MENPPTAYVVVSHGGGLGVGDKRFAIPWSVFLIDTRSIAKVDPTWQRGIDEYYGVEVDRREALLPN